MGGADRWAVTHNKATGSAGGLFTLKEYVWEGQEVKIVDLSHRVHSEMPVYPGTEPPRFVTACTLEKEGFVEQKITLFSHTGTHVDAPAHMLQDGKTLDMLPVSHFVGTSSVIDVRNLGKETIEVSDLEPQGHLLERSEFVLIHTGWSRYWGTQMYFHGFPVFSDTAAKWMTGFKLKGVGVDAISVDKVGVNVSRIHEILLRHEIIITENLTHLEALPSSDFIYCCLPLYTREADGSPVRAVAILK